MRTLLFTLLALLPALAHAQTYGIASRPSFTAFNGNLPTNLPTFSGSWSAVPAFPNLTFQNIMGVHEMPAQPSNARKLVIYEREGRIYSVPRPSASNAAAPFTAADLNNTHKTLLLDISNQCQGWDDSGLMSMAYHPNYASNGYVYVYYMYVTPGTVIGDANTRPPVNVTHKDRLSRFIADPVTGIINPASEQVLINLVSASTWHAGGGMFFHPTTGFLHMTFGDDTVGANRQQITTNFRSSVIRIDVNMTGGSVSHAIPKQPVTPAGSSTANYFIPNDNPFIGVANAMEEIYCLGLRSPHTMNFDAVSGRAFIGDVGEGTKEEVDVVEPGESGLNFQWAVIEGLNGDLVQPYIGINKRPIIDYPRGDGTAVIGGRVYRAAEFAGDLGGKYIFGDNVSGNVWYLDETTTPKSKVFLCTVPEGSGVNTGSDYRGISFFGTDNDNEFYICQLGTTSAQLYKLQRSGAAPPTMPATLSATGLFSNVSTITPSSSFIPFDVNTPLWSDNAHKQRWFAIPDGQTIGFSATGDYTFPQGSVWLKHFELPIDDNNPATRKKLETRVLVRDNDGGVYGVTYKWRSDGSDADIVNASETEDITINGTSEIGMSLATTDIGTQVFDQATTNIGTGFEVTIRSGDIWNNSDNFRFLHAQKTGDFDARVRVESLTAAATYTKAGIMARSSTAADSPHVFAMVFPSNAARNNNNGGHELQYRTITAGASAAVYPTLPHPRVSYPQTWLRLKREGNTFIHYWSDNGTTWKEYGRRTQAMPATLELGLATTSNTTGTATTARFHLNLQRTQTWTYPGKADCLQCHRSGSGLVLGQTTAQSNRNYEFAAALNGTASPVTDNQLRAWAHAGYFDTPPVEANIPNLLKMSAITDQTATLEQRMRSYLDANCAHCHQSSGGGVHAFWDGRYELTLAQTGIVNGFVSNSLGLTNTPKTIVPGSIERSIMHARDATATAAYKMPPLAKSLVDQDYITLLEQWIGTVTQPPGDPLPSPWVGGDIGSVTVAGAATTFNSTFILSSNGTGITGTADSMQAASYQLVSGDGELLAQVSSLDTGTTGVMVRETLDANSKHGSTLLTPTGQSMFSRRLTTGGTTVTSNGSTSALPRWVKIRRRGPNIESYTSPDGTTWSLIGSVQIAMAQSVYFCLVHSSNVATTTGNATFDNVSVTPGVFGTGATLAVNNTAANAISWDAISGITGTSVANGPVLWYQNDTLNFTGTGGTVTLAGAMNMNTGLLNIDATTGSFSLTGGSLISGGIRIGTGDNVTISSTLTGTAVNIGALGVHATTGILGSGTLTLNTTPTHTGTLTIQSGVTNVNGNAVDLSSGTGISINGSGLRIAAATGYPYDSGLLRGGLLQMTQGGVDQIGTQMVTLNGGTLLYRDNAGGNQTAAVQNLTLATGGSTLITAVQGGSIGDTLSITNLTRSVGATLEARSAYGTLGGTGDLGRVSITNLNGLAAANTNGILGGWAAAGSAATASNAFAILTANGLAAAVPNKSSVANAGSTTAVFNTGTATENWLVNSNSTVDGNSIATLTVNSLIEQNDVILNNGAKLVLGSGGLILRTASFWMQTSAGAGGKLTTGLTSGELFVRSAELMDVATDQRLRVRIEDNGATPLILIKSGPGRLNLGGNTGTGTITNAYTGGTFINEGGIYANDSSALGTGAITVRPGGGLWIAGGITVGNALSISGFGATHTAGAMGALRMDNNAIASGAITLVGNARIEVTTAGNLGTLSGIVSGTGTGLEKTGAGILLLSNLNNSFTGDIVINGGTLRANGLINGALANGNLGANSGSRTITANTGTTIDWTSNNIFAGAGASASSVPGIVLNAATMQSSRFNVIGNVTLNGSTLVQTSSDAGMYQGYQFLGSITVGGTAASTISTTNAKGNHLLGGGNNLVTVEDATASTAVDLTISTVLLDGSGDYVGAGSLTKAGLGTLLLTANNSYTGTSTINSGSVQLGNGSAGGSLGTGAITNNGAILVNRDTSTSLTLNTISGTGTYTQTNGSVIMSAVNAFAGPTIINAGTLQLNGGGITGGLRGIATINAGATIRSNANDSLGYGGGQKVNTLNINGGTLDHISANNLTLASVMINMDGGTLQAISGNAANMLDFFGGGTTIVTSAAATTTSTLSGQVRLRQNNSTFTVNDGSAAIDLAVSGPITNTAEGNNVVIKEGTGTMTLAGANTYVGATNLNAGTLILTGSLISNLTVATGATLGGTGSTTGSVMVNGIISPGASAGAFTAGATTLAVNSVYQWEVGNWSGVAGVGYDTINAASLSITATNVAPIALRLRNLAGSGFTETSRSFTLASTTGGITGFALNKFQLDTSEFTAAQGVWTLTQIGNNLILGYTPHADGDGDGMFDDYELLTFGSTGFSPGNSDTDGDGIADLLEYATDLSPTAGNVGNWTSDIETLGPDQHLRLTVTKNPNAAHLTYVIEVSSTLTSGSWTPATIEVNTATQLIARDPIKKSDATQRFIRLRVQP